MSKQRKLTRMEYGLLVLIGSGKVGEFCGEGVEKIIRRLMKMGLVARIGAAGLSAPIITPAGLALLAELDGQEEPA